ncbi:MAG: exodeoxyribonuclease VII large subunit [Bacteroidia bacterium]|nr:exodeoxyribonuclease VII large subunit [Bacteroidia bacterium]
MKLRHLFFSCAAFALTFAACDPKEDLGPEEVTLSGASAIELATSGDEVTLSLKATVDWTLQGYDADVQTWLVISPSSGKASKDAQTITVKALENKETDRTANIVFYGNILCKAPLTITQKGPEGEEAEYETLTVAQFLAKKDTNTEYILKGTISDVTKNASGSYWGFTLTDDTGSVSCPFIENWDEFPLKNGDKVSVRGKYSYYEKKSQDQLANGTVVEYEAVDTPDVDYDNAKSLTVADFIKAADKTTYYKLSGIVSGFNSTYCSFNLTDESGSIYVYSVENKSDWSDKISNGGKVTLAGKYDYYSPKSQHEVVDAHILSFEAGEGGDDEDDDPVTKPTQATAVTVAEFLEKPVNTTDWYEITGTIASITGAEYGNFYVKDESGQVYVYGLTKDWADGKNDKSFSQIGLKAGDKLTFWTLRSEYNGTAQAGGSSCPALYISHEAGQETEYPEGSVVLTFPDDNRDNNKVNDYVSTWTAKIGGNEFDIQNFNNYQWQNWTYIKCGRKKDPSVAKIASSTAVAATIAKVVLTADTYDASSMNSLTLNVYSDASLSTQVCSVSAPEDAAAGDIEFAVPADRQAGNLYYEIVFDCKVSTASKNGFVQLSKLAYIAAE